MSVNILNDDCLYLIVQYLDLIDLLNLEKASVIFHEALKRKFTNVHFKIDIDQNMALATNEAALNEIVARFKDQIRSLSIVVAIGDFLWSDTKIMITKNIIRICCEKITKLEKLKIKIGQPEFAGLFGCDRFTEPCSESSPQYIWKYLSKFELIQNLLELDLSENGFLDHEINPLIQSCKKLERLNLSRNNFIRGTCLDKVTWIKDLDLSNCSITLVHLLKFCQESTQLEKLNVVGIDKGDHFMRRLFIVQLCDLLKKRQPNLRTLFLMDPQFQNQINLAGLNGSEAFQQMAEGITLP